MAKKIPNIRSAYDVEHFRVTKEIVGDSLTEQSHAEGCDVNRIMTRARQGAGIVPPAVSPRFLDCPNPVSLGEAIALIRNGQEEFMKLPVEMRARFNHDYGALVVALEDEAKADILRGEFEEMGVLERKEEPEVEETPAEPPAPNDPPVAKPEGVS